MATHTIHTTILKLLEEVQVELQPPLQLVLAILVLAPMEQALFAFQFLVARDAGFFTILNLPFGPLPISYHRDLDVGKLVSRSKHA